MDNQVLYHEPAKLAAKIREHQTGPLPILLQINMKGDHGGTGGRFGVLGDTAFDYAFILDQLRVSSQRIAEREAHDLSIDMLSKAFLY